ncbi:UPF0669 protein [Nymphon striatum]|nr:UPF0669 protein [Nymphon striatum]
MLGQAKPELIACVGLPLLIKLKCSSVIRKHTYLDVEYVLELSNAKKLTDTSERRKDKLYYKHEKNGYQVQGEVEAGNYTYYTLNTEGRFILTLSSEIGDADIYVSDSETHPTFEVDGNCLQGESQNKARGYLRLINCKDTLAYIHLMKDILTPLKTLSVILQSNQTTLADVKEKMEVCTSVINTYQLSDGPSLARFMQHIMEDKFQGFKLGGNLDNFGSTRTLLAKRILDALKKRYADLHDQAGIIAATEIANFHMWPKHENESGRQGFGNDKVRTLCLHFKNTLEKAEIQGWSSEVHNPYLEGHRNILPVIDLIRTLPASSLENERGFSNMKQIKIDRRARIKTPTLDHLITIQMPTFMDGKAPKRARLESLDDNTSEEVHEIIYDPKNVCDNESDDSDSDSDDNEMSEEESVTCGIDEVEISSDLNRPIGIGIYGHPTHLKSKYSLQLKSLSLELNNQYESMDKDYEANNNMYGYISSNKYKATPKPPSKPTEDESILWTIFVGLRFWDKNMWPSSSPDISPMDFAIKFILKSDILTKSYSSVVALKEALLASWSTFDEEVVHISCHSVTGRLEVMVNTKEGQFEI